jgi:ribosomal peptide maturation radical SAM protein 1
MSSGGVALIAFPWQRFNQMSLQLGVLTSFLREHGIPVETGHYYRDFVEFIGRDAYDKLFYASCGEALFAAILFPQRRRRIESVLRKRVQDLPPLDAMLKGCNAYVNSIVHDKTWDEFRLIGITTTHEQLITSLCVARALKQKWPRSRIAMGGALLDAQSGGALLSLFPEIDLVVYGEGEETLLEIARTAAVQQDISLGDVQGVVYRNHREIIATGRRALLPKLDELPFPDYSDYFLVSRRRSTRKCLPWISLEMSRGCSWGRCTFCNLHIQWKGPLRRKSAERIVAEVREAVNQNRSSRITFCDTNTSAFGDAYRALEKQCLGLDMFAEVSAHLNREDLECMGRAGLRSLQVGIESFSERILQKFQKGISVMRNIEMLKWVAELGIRIDYNILIRYPDELAEDVESTLRVIRYARWFAPPHLGNYSVSFESCAARESAAHNISGARIPRDYQRIYPKDVLKGISRLLVLWMEPIPSEKRNIDWKPVQDLVDKWRTDHAASGKYPRLVWRDTGEFVIVEEQSVKDHEAEIWRLTGVLRDVYLACDRQSLTIAQLAKELAIHDEDDVKRAVSELDASGILFYHGGRALSLAIRQV